jgi:hypothetical protein
MLILDSIMSKRRTKKEEEGGGTVAGQSDAKLVPLSAFRWLPALALLSFEAANNSTTPLTIDIKDSDERPGSSDRTSDRGVAHGRLGV